MIDYDLYRFLSMKNRITHLWYLVSWIICLSFIVILYQMIISSKVLDFGPNTWTHIDQGYIVLRGFFVILIITNIVSSICHEIKYAFSMEHLVIRKFLPTIRFIILLLIWIA